MAGATQKDRKTDKPTDANGEDTSSRFPFGVSFGRPAKGDMSKMPKKVKVRQFRVNLNIRRVVIWLLILLLFVPMLVGLLADLTAPDEVSLSEFVSDVREGKVHSVEVIGNRLKIAYKDAEETVVTNKEPETSVVEIFTSAGIDLTSIDIVPIDQSTTEAFWSILLNVGPLLLMAVFFFFIIKQARGSQDGIMGFGRSKAKLFSKGKQDVTFKDVGGVTEAKKELEEIVDFLKNPKKYHKLGARTPKGVLLVGPSGTGKTLLARAVAGEANAPFFSMAGSEFMEMLVGVGASRVRDLFDTAKKASPAIIFIDEIDAIGRMRGLGTAGGHDEREQTLNQILVEMDGFTQSDNVIVMAATNRGDLLDPALTRPGRFDRRVSLVLPDIEEREYILKIHAQGKPFVKGINWNRVARRTVGFSGADLENMLNEAAIQTARESKTEIGWDQIEESATKVKLGPQKRRLQSELERRMTAYHEAGHAVIAHLAKHADPVHRISIVSRGMALGYTLTPPEQDKYHQTKSELYDRIAVLLGGRAAEDLVFDELTGGASSDITKATQIARAMVVDFGMSDLGPIALGPQYDMSEWGRAIMEPTRLSNEMQAKVDKEISSIISEVEKRVNTLLVKHRKQLDAVADSLMEEETIDGELFEKVMGVKKARTASNEADGRDRKMSK